MKVKSYKVICLACKGSNIVPIDEDRRIILWKDSDSIVSGRYRLDNQWGWQCLCGSNSLLTEQEDRCIDDKVNPDPVQIEQVVNNLVPDERVLFEMRVS